MNKQNNRGNRENNREKGQNNRGKVAILGKKWGKALFFVDIPKQNITLPYLSHILPNTIIYYLAL